MGFLDVNESVMAAENGENPDQQKQQADHDEKKAISRHAFFVAHWAQPLDAASGEVIDELRIGSGRRTKMVFDAAKQRGEVIFAHAQIVVMLSCHRLALRLQTLLVHFLENGFA